MSDKKQKELSGAIFPNSKKTKEGQPHFTGKCLIDGTSYFISGWGQFSQNGEKYISLSFTKAGEVQSAKKAADEMLNEF